MKNLPPTFTVFGGSFVTEEHAAASTKRPLGPMTAIVAALVFGTMISASAVAGLNRQSANPITGSPFFSSQQLGFGAEVALW